MNTDEAAPPKLPLQWGMRKQIAWFTLIVVTLACQAVPTPPPLTPTAPPRVTATRPAGLPATLPAETTPLGAPAPTPAAIPGQMDPFPAYPASGFAALQPVEWSRGEAGAAPGPELPLDPARLANPGVIAGLSLRQQTALLRDGFVIAPTGEAQFAAIRARVSDRYGQPYYLTVDAATHAVQLSIADLRLAVEREELHRRMIVVAQATLDEVLSYLPFVRSGPLEADVLQAAIYLGTGLRLLDPDLKLPEVVAERAERQAGQAVAAAGIQDALLIPGYSDNFAVYRPGAPYASNPELASYYRGRVWFGRATFALDGPDAGRAPLILTMALRRAKIPSGAGAPADTPYPAADEWARISDTLAFFEGAPAAYGPRQTALLMDQVYGAGVTMVGLGDPGQWEQLRRLAGALPPAELGRAPQNPFLADQPSSEWRWLPSGVRLDDSLRAFLNAYHRQNPRGAAHSAALELAAVLGSQPALDLVSAAAGGLSAGETSGFARARAAFGEFTPAGWGASTEGLLYFSLAALASPKDADFLPMQRSAGWQKRELASTLAAWVRARAPAGAYRSSAASAARPQSAAPPAAVEPDPPAFYRLSFLAGALVDGLERRGLNGVFSTSPDPHGLRAQTQELLTLAERLERLGDIAAGELRGQPPGPDEWALIAGPLGAAEERAPDGAGLPPTPALIEWEDARGALQVSATGRINRLYALVTLGEQVYVAQGGVYSYYEFPEALYGPFDPASKWEFLLANQPVTPPEWLGDLLQPEGAAVDVLAFHAGEALQVTPAARRLNVRAEPGRGAAVVRRISAGDTLTLLEDVARADGQTWRRARLADGVEGWVVEDPTFYNRI